MSFAEGIAAGTRVAELRDSTLSSNFNPWAVMAYLRRPTAAPRIIRDNAAELALKQKQLELEERKIALAEEQARKASALAERQQVFSEINQDRADTLAQRRQALEERKFETSLGMTREKQQEQRDFALAKWGLATNNPQPIIDYFQKYGNKGVYVESMEFGPDGDILVKFSNQKKPAYFKSKDEFYTAFMGFADPKVQAELIKRKTEIEKAKINALAKARQGANPYKITLTQAYKEYDARFREPSGELKPDAPDRDTWARNFVAQNMAFGALQQPQLITVTSQAQQGYTEKRKPTGEFLRIWDDGTKEYFAPNGQLQYVMSPDGIRYRLGTLGFEKYRKTRIPAGEAPPQRIASQRKNEVAVISPGTLTPKGWQDPLSPPPDYWQNQAALPVLTTPKQLPAPKEKEALPNTKITKGQTVKATYIDKKTGDKVEVTIDANGKITKKIVKKAKKKD